jgi:hypothetical protein
MIRTVIIAIPALLSLIECVRRGPEHAFLSVYLPVLLLLPGYTWPISGELSFADTAILPIAAYIFFRPRTKWQWNSIDILVIGYMALTAVADGMNKGYKEGTQNLAVQDVFIIFLPYFAAKHMFRHPQFAVDVAKRVAMLLSIVAVISVYEFRMGSDMFTRLCEEVFPSSGNTVVFRLGFMRTQGPYGHAIAMGIMMAVGFRIARWLEWSGEWKESTHFLPISKVRFCQLCIAVGSFMSLSVGPWLAAACGSVVISTCRAQNRKRAITSLILLIALFGQPIHSSFKSFVSVDPSVSDNRWQQDSIYRNNLIPLYIPVVEERSTWGWGRNGFPVVDGMGSIDNAYLLEALTFGLYALGMLVALFVWPAIQLANFSFPLSRNDPRALAAFTLIGIYVLNVVVDGTASGGGTPWRFFFIIAGWSVALLNSKGPAILELKVVKSSPRTQVGFRRVMV